MCGIAGVLDLRGREAVSHKTLKRMADVMAYRGPDDEGYYVDGYLGMAHRRLAVIDPSPAGRQPMVSKDGRLAVVFNGTIFNYQELSAELTAQGHQFMSKCDTEVLVHGWEQWGESLVDHLNGHFAFVVWDSWEQRLTMVRDRFGVKPLYYANLGGLWIFASEIKAIMAHPAYSVDVDPQALYEYFTFQNLFRYHTLFKGVRLVPQAGMLTIQGRDGSSHRRSWWDFDFSRPDQGMTLQDAREELYLNMVQAVRRQLVSDVPVGGYLSGGMDSGSIVAIASRELSRMNTFTCGWHMGGVEGLEASFDERVWAELISERFNTEHFEQVVGHHDLVWALPRVVYHLEDLRLGMSYGQYYIARLASKFVKVCLGGAGGDELFGGYPWRYYRISHSLDKEQFFANYYDYWQRLVPDDARASFFSPELLRRVGDTDMKQVLKSVFTFHPGLSFDTPEDHIANSLYFECKTFLPGLLLVADKMSMAHGLEERLPFLDNDLADLAMRIPIGMKLENLEQWKRQDENVHGKKKQYFAAHADGKKVLRDVMGRIIPAEICERPKQGFSSPDESWYRGRNLRYVLSLVLDKKALCHEYIQPQFIERVVDQHCNQGVNHRLLIWSLICFEAWLRIFVEGLGNRLSIGAADCARLLPGVDGCKIAA